MSDFVKDTIERALLTFCEAMLGFITIGMPIYELDWKSAISVSATAALATLLKQVVVHLKNTDNVEILDEVDTIEEEADEDGID